MARPDVRRICHLAPERPRVYRVETGYLFPNSLGRLCAASVVLVTCSPCRSGAPLAHRAFPLARAMAPEARPYATSGSAAPACRLPSSASTIVNQPRGGSYFSPALSGRLVLVQCVAGRYAVSLLVEGGEPAGAVEATLDSARRAPTEIAFSVVMMHCQCRPPVRRACGRHRSLRVPGRRPIRSGGRRS